MPGFDVEAYVRANGPIWHRLIGRKVEVASEELSKQLAERGKELVLKNLAERLKTRTPYYETQIEVRPFGITYSVSDSGVIYGPWLEGTGSRNPVTSFPGYHSFEDAHDELEKEVPAYARAVFGTAF